MPNTERNTEDYMRALASLIDSSPDTLPAFLAEIHAADLAAWMQYNSGPHAGAVFRALDAEARADLRGLDPVGVAPGLLLPRSLCREAPPRRN